MSTRILLNSACNCCETIPYPALKFETRSKGASVTGCGFTEGNAVYRQKKITFTSNGEYLQRHTGVGQDEGFDFYGQVDEGGTTQVTERIEVSLNRCDCMQYYVSGFFWDEVSAYYPPEVYVNVEYSEVVPSEEVIERGESCLDIQQFDVWSENAFATSEKRYYPHRYSTSVSELRLKHPPTVTGYLKIWLWQRTLNISTSEYQYFDQYTSQNLSPFAEYVWTGEPNDLNFGVNAEENEITSDVFGIIAEDTNIRMDVFIGKWSLLPEYEPADPILDPNSDLSQINPNLPSWIRPRPDCFSSGTPTVNAICPASLF